MSRFKISKPPVGLKEIERLCHSGSKNKFRSKVAIWRGDITRLKLDAIVNAANETLLGGGGVDGAIHAAAGRELLEECKSLDGCKTGQAKITKGYKLPAKRVIHTVGPIGENESKLTNCYKNSLDLLIENKLKTVAFPCISTGIYGYPNEGAAHVALGTTLKWLTQNHDKVDLIVFCLFLKVDVSIYKELAEEYFPVDSRKGSPKVETKSVKTEQQIEDGVETALSNINAVKQENLVDDQNCDVPKLCADITECASSTQREKLVEVNEGSDEDDGQKRNPSSTLSTGITTCMASMECENSGNLADPDESSERGDHQKLMNIPRNAESLEKDAAEDYVERDSHASKKFKEMSENEIAMGSEKIIARETKSFDKISEKVPLQNIAAEKVSKI